MINFFRRLFRADQDVLVTRGPVDAAIVAEFMAAWRFGSQQ